MPQPGASAPRQITKLRRSQKQAVQTMKSPLTEGISESR